MTFLLGAYSCSLCILCIISSLGPNEGSMYELILTLDLVGV